MDPNDISYFKEPTLLLIYFTVHYYSPDHPTFFAPVASAAASGRSNFVISFKILIALIGLEQNMIVLSTDDNLITFFLSLIGCAATVGNINPPNTLVFR